jgi:hypothetical protein
MSWPAGMCDIRATGHFCRLQSARCVAAPFSRKLTACSPGLNLQESSFVPARVLERICDGACWPQRVDCWCGAPSSHPVFFLEKVEEQNPQ